MDTSTKCPECGAYQGHSITCERKTPAEWRESALLYHGEWLKLVERNNGYLNKAYGKVKAMQKEAAFWHGKFAIVKHENNALRRKLKK